MEKIIKRLFGKKEKEKVKISLEKRVMERIHGEKVKLTPYWIIFTKRFLKVLFVLILFLLEVFFVSLFINKITIAKVLGFGFVVHNLPWFSFGLSLSLFMLLFAFMENFKYFYRWGLGTLLIVLFLVISSIGFVVHKTNLHEMGRREVTALYDVDGKPLQILAGSVVELRTQKSFVLRSVWGARTNVYLSPNAYMSESVSQDESVFVIGTKEGTVFYAKGVLVLSRVKN